MMAAATMIQTPSITAAPMIAKMKTLPIACNNVCACHDVGGSGTSAAIKDGAADSNNRGINILRIFIHAG